jgi:hypothetical protein
VLTANDDQDNEPEVPSSPVVAKKARAPAKAKKPAPKPAKRQSREADSRSRKKQKTKSKESSEELSSPLSELESTSGPEVTPKKTTNPRKSAKKEAASPKKSAKSKAEPVNPETRGDGDVVAGDKSESELSSLVDEEPKPKKKGKGKDSQQSKSKKPKATKRKPQAEEDRDQAEIKRLQGWLVKCGIRKLWGKELKPYETPKAKIQHLKGMLVEAGMTGRYSIEKANQIKEARELAADIEAVQEGEQRWGTGDKEADGEEAQPQRRVIRGAKHYDFLSSDGEETD